MELSKKKTANIYIYIYIGKKIQRNKEIESKIVYPKCTFVFVREHMRTQLCCV